MRIIMGRNQKCSGNEFKKAYKKASSAKELASILNIAIPTVYAYMIRYRVKPYPPSEANTLNPVDLGVMYNFNVTIDDIARKLHVSRTTVYYCLRKLVLYPKQYTLTPRKKDRLPPPKTIPEIKIILLIKQHPKYIDNPWEMVGLPGITKGLVDSYYRHAFGYTLSEYEKGVEE